MPSSPTPPPEYVIAQAIADAINAATFEGMIGSVAATVDEAPDYENLDAPQNTTPAIYVVPGPQIEIEAGTTRGADLHTFDIIVILVKRLGDDTERMALADLRTQITKRLLRDRWAAGSLRAGVPAEFEYQAGPCESTYNREGVRGPKVFEAQILARFSSLIARH